MVGELTLDEFIGIVIGCTSSTAIVVIITVWAIKRRKAYILEKKY